jgi:murein L,D-transpeptidase YcbB/YkuD
VVLPRFYEARAYQPAWTGDNGPLPHVDNLVKAIQDCWREALKPRDYHLEKIEHTLAGIRRDWGNKKSLDPYRLVDFDLLLTDAFLIYAAHLVAGRVNPETIDPEWHANRRELDLAQVLEVSLQSGQIDQALKGLLPKHEGYARLKRALVQYRDISARGGWVSLPHGPKLQMGDRDERVVALRRRLGASGDLVLATAEGGEVFDEGVEEAVRKFQKRHGLDVDGIVGPATLGALNVPAEDRISEIEVNLERWRWLPQGLGEGHILVNIPDFQLYVVENGLTVMHMRIIVGKGYRRTPVFSDKMTYLVLCPYWHVPPNIAVQDKLPLIRKNIKYLDEQHMKIFHGWGADTKEIDPHTIDWSTVNAKNLTFRLRQDPGPRNALGRVKFMFPNRFNVYFHDTPSQELFGKTTRAFSSGCIRLEKPVELADYVLRGNPNWSPERISAVIAEWVERTVQLSKPIPIHVLYWTVWVDEDGTIQFRNDIYGRDKPLRKALGEQPPTPS